MGSEKEGGGGFQTGSHLSLKIPSGIKISQGNQNVVEPVGSPFIKHRPIVVGQGEKNGNFGRHLSCFGAGCCVFSLRSDDSDCSLLLSGVEICAEALKRDQHTFGDQIPPSSSPHRQCQEGTMCADVCDCVSRSYV